MSFGTNTQVLAAIVSMAAANLTVAAPETSAPAIVLKAKHLFDSVSGKLMEPGMVVVQGDKIRAVGVDLKVPDGAQVIELGDATLLPRIYRCSRAYGG